MDRRAMLMTLMAGAGLLPYDAAAGAGSLPETAAPDPSLYIPDAHRVEDRAFLHDFMDRFAFVDLVTTSPTLRITHIPVVLDRTSGGHGTVLGHVAAKNPQQGTFDGTQTALVVFRGPHGYISPAWYGSRQAVPTWNFSVVHASGRPRAITDRTKVHSLLSRLIRKFETAVGSDYDFAALPEEYVTRMMQGISAFEMPIEALEGKFKLGHERQEADRAGVLEHLKKGAYREPTLYEVTEAFYRMKPR